MLGVRPAADGLTRSGAGDDLAASRAVVVGAGFTGLACVAGAVLISAIGDRLAERVISRLPWDRVRRAAGVALRRHQRYLSHHGALGNVLVKFRGGSNLRVIQAYFLGLSNGMQQPLVTYSRSFP